MQSTINEDYFLWKIQLKRPLNQLPILEKKPVIADQTEAVLDVLSVPLAVKSDEVEVVSFFSDVFTFEIGFETTVVSF